MIIIHLRWMELYRGVGGSSCCAGRQGFSHRERYDPHLFFLLHNFARSERRGGMRVLEMCSWYYYIMSECCVMLFPFALTSFIFWRRGKGRVCPSYIHDLLLHERVIPTSFQYGRSNLNCLQLVAG
jgi:hypothetical protein